MYSNIHEYLWSQDAVKTWLWEDHISEISYEFRIHVRVFVMSLHIILYDLMFVFQIW